MDHRHGDPQSEIGAITSDLWLPKSVPKWNYWTSKDSMLIILQKTRVRIMKTNSMMRHYRDDTTHDSSSGHRISVMQNAHENERHVK
jgi:hypothetical protein